MQNVVNARIVEDVAALARQGLGQVSDTVNWRSRRRAPTCNSSPRGIKPNSPAPLYNHRPSDRPSCHFASCRRASPWRRRGGCSPGLGGRGNRRGHPRGTEQRHARGSQPPARRSAVGGLRGALHSRGHSPHACCAARNACAWTANRRGRGLRQHGRRDATGGSRPPARCLVSRSCKRQDLGCSSARFRRGDGSRGRCPRSARCGFHSCPHVRYPREPTGNGRPTAFARTATAGAHSARSGLCGGAGWRFLPPLQASHLRCCRTSKPGTSCVLGYAPQSARSAWAPAQPCKPRKDSCASIRASLGWA